MDKKAIAQRLRALASDDKKRSKAARLRDVIDEVEAALSAGVSQTSVVEELAEQGLDIPIGSFRTALKRIRQQRGKRSLAASAPNAVSTPTTSLVGIEPAREADNSVQGSHNPADLDKIIGATPDMAALAKLGKKRK
jgi:hypothetical protein